MSTQINNNNPEIMYKYTIQQIDGLNSTQGSTNTILTTSASKRTFLIAINFSAAFDATSDTTEVSMSYTDIGNSLRKIRAMHVVGANGMINVRQDFPQPIELKPNTGIGVVIQNGSAGNTKVAGAAIYIEV